MTLRTPLTWKAFVHAVTAHFRTRGQWAYREDKQTGRILVSNGDAVIEARPIGDGSKVRWQVTRELYDVNYSSSTIPEPDMTFGVGRTTSIGASIERSAADLLSYGVIAAAFNAADYKARLDRAKNDRVNFNRSVADQIMKLGVGGKIVELSERGANIRVPINGYTAELHVDGHEVTFTRLTTNATEAVDVIRMLKHS